MSSTPSAPVKTPPPAITGISRWFSLRKAITSAVIFCRLYASQSKPKPRWPPAKGPSTTTKSGSRPVREDFFRKMLRARTLETTIPSLACLKRLFSAIMAKEEICRPAERLMPSMPASSAAFKRCGSVLKLSFIVSFSMQLMKTRPSPVLRFITSSTHRCVARSISSGTNSMSVFGARPEKGAQRFALSFTKCVPKRRSLTSAVRASEIWPTPPRRAASSASSRVEIFTPMPPTMIGLSSLSPSTRR